MLGLFGFDLSNEDEKTASFADPLPRPDFPQVNPVADQRAETQMSLRYFRIDGFARFLLKKLNIEGTSKLPWVDIRILDAGGQIARQVTIARDELVRNGALDVQKSLTLDSAGLAPGIYRVEVYAIYGAIAFFGGYAVFASALQLSTDWGPAWGNVFIPDNQGEWEFRKSFVVQLVQ